tara:strand:+ start:253 stop:1509 length:1257 start_codon:yes stop_codon:yes gene_type:complete
MYIKLFKSFLCFIFVGTLYSETTLIKNATIYDGIENIPFQGNILIENDTIKKVSSAKMQADFVIDASGMIVTPGIIGTDTNIGIVEIGALSVTRDDSSEIYSIGFSIHDAFNPKSTLIPWNRSNGVTSALSLPQGTASPIGGLGSFFVLDGEHDITSKKDIVMIGGVGESGSSSRAETFAVMDDLLSFASGLNSADLDDISEIIEKSSIAEFMELHPRDVKALSRLVNNNLPLIISTHRASDILKLIELKEKYDLNLIIKGAQDASLVAPQIAASGTPLIINPINNIPGSFDELASNIQMASRLEEKGIDLMFNTPRSHNFHLVRQGAGVAVANGMSYEGAIKAITSTPAKVFNIDKRGEIKAGYFADIVVWDADPLEPSSMPEYLFINGKNVDMTTRSSRLRDRYTKEPEKPNTYRD